MTQLYVLAAINLAKKLHPALKHINMPSDSKLFFDTEMFAAIRLLQGPQQALLELVEDEASIRQRDVLIKFVIGLWCDSQNAWFMEHLGSVRGQLDPQTHPHPGCTVELSPRTVMQKLGV
ncbi:hypothetical protein NP493_2365g00005 [Ridgeia piscesae]|uniref:Uncharacterized protein n=1 Tax=Ridgeia piscesae TaxID=27915 RepID=A0AAD9N1A5_RIDPI|nr:hypothetical protein NP493_2365g00005 [Ridgeia piscesae]